MKIFCDASFLVSLYSPDVNSASAAQVMGAVKDTCLITSLVELEVVNALRLRVFRKEATLEQARSSLRDFELDLQQGIFQICPVSDEMFERARQLSRQVSARLGTRTADLLHVAAALELKAKYLYSFDQNQRKLARATGLALQ